MFSNCKDTNFSVAKTILIQKKLYCLDTPKVMGIVNLTDDSFFDGGKYNTLDNAIRRVERIVSEGVDIIDLGACSTRPGATLVSKQEEIVRLKPVLKEVKKRYPEVPVSVDTVWGDVVAALAEEGLDIVNDISGGQFDDTLFDMVAKYHLPYILMHTNTTPDKMQKEIHYDNLSLDMCKYFSQKISVLQDKGVEDIILDLGFGFGKTMEMNYYLLSHQRDFSLFSLPILTGISRKSMIYKPLGITPQDALCGTTFLHAFALENGADILRVHDVKVAKDCIKLFEIYKNNSL